MLSIHGITESEDGWSEGRLVVGRIEFHPLGEMPLTQGDLDRRPLRLRRRRSSVSMDERS